MRDALIQHYGLTDETVRLLVGSDATRDGIRRLFGEEFLGDPDKVTADDAVLFFFAGHGNRRESAGSQKDFVGLLYPADIRAIPGKGVDSTSCVQIREILDGMRDFCAAQHKLVILDSCHSGEVCRSSPTARPG
ncbi:MAG: caspase family protein [Arachnia sp.]